MTNPAHTPVALDEKGLEAAARAKANQFAGLGINAESEISNADGAKFALWQVELEDAAEIIRAYLSAVGGEAVAWRYWYNGRWYVCDSEDFARKGLDAHPLYASPQPANPAQETDSLHGPFGWLNGHRALSEDSWTLESDPLENSEEYFAIPLYALVDPFKEIGKDWDGRPALDASRIYSQEASDRAVDRLDATLIYDEEYGGVTNLTNCVDVVAESLGLRRAGIAAIGAGGQAVAVKALIPESEKYISEIDGLLAEGGLFRGQAMALQAAKVALSQPHPADERVVPVPVEFLQEIRGWLPVDGMNNISNGFIARIDGFIAAIGAEGQEPAHPDDEAVERFASQLAEMRVERENETYRTAFDGIEPAAQEGREAVAWPKILYVCEYCHENNPEMCGHDRNDLYVTPDGRWLCEECLEEEEGISHADCASPPKLYTHPAPPQPAALTDDLQRLLEATNRKKVGQPYLVSGTSPRAIVDHAIRALDLSMMRHDMIEDLKAGRVKPALAAPVAQPANPAQVTDGPISQQEMVALFGSEMPIEAVTLLYEAPEGWTCSDLRRRLREIAAIGAGREEPVGEWAIDHSTDSPILTYEKCSVIQDEQAFYVLGLIRAAIGAGGQAVAMDRRSIGEAIINASNCKDETLAIDDKHLTLCPADGVVRIDLKRITAALSQPHPADERVAEALRTVRPEIKSETDILKRLADGDEIAFSEDGDEAFFTKGDRAFVGPVITSMRSKGYLKRIVLNDENYRGTAERDVISGAGRAALASLEDRA